MIISFFRKKKASDPSVGFVKNVRGILPVRKNASQRDGDAGSSGERAGPAWGDAFGGRFRRRCSWFSLRFFREKNGGGPRWNGGWRLPFIGGGRRFVVYNVYIRVRHTVLPTLCAVFAIVFGREQKLRTQKVRTLARCGPFVPSGSTEDYFAVRLWLPPRRAYRLPCHSKTPETFSGSEMSACSSPRLPTW